MSLLNLSHSIHNRIWRTVIRQFSRTSFDSSFKTLVNVTNDGELIEICNSQLPNEFRFPNSRLTRGNSTYDFEILGIIQGIQTYTFKHDMVKLYVSAVNEEGRSTTYKVRGHADGPSSARILDLKVDDIALIQGHANSYRRERKVNLENEEEFYYHGALQATVLGRVIGEFVATPDPFYEGYIKMLTWNYRTKEHVQGRTSRVMISKEGMERLSFIKEVRVGEKLLINGVLENMVVPNVFGNLLVVSAKEALRFEETKTSNGEALSIV